MSKTAHGAPRYAKHDPQPLARMMIDGMDLGPGMRPQDIFVWLRHIMELDVDEVVDAFRLAAAELQEHPEFFAELAPADIQTALDQAAEVTRSRVVAWRKRNRQMTWLELRMLFLGVKLIR